MRQYTKIDRFISSLDQRIRNLFAPQAERTNPAIQVEATNLNNEEASLSARLMRVNHTGEVCAQALYHGQAISARSLSTRQHMQIAAQEETDHLAWCQTRIKELGSHTSYLNPFWYVQSFSIGLLAGLAGDRWSLGFVRETERQVIDHIDKHLQRLPQTDTASRAILLQMRTDEQQHTHQAEQAGAAELPWLVRQTMRLTAKVMTTTAYWI